MADCYKLKYECNEKAFIEKSYISQNRVARLVNYINYF